jgi:hypothetical protein
MEDLTVIETWLTLLIPDPCVFTLCMCIFLDYKLKLSKAGTDFRRMFNDAGSSRDMTKCRAVLSQLNWGEF